MSFELKWFGDKIVKNVDTNVKKKLKEAALFLESKAIPQTPKKIGNLRSGYVVDEKDIDEGIVYLKNEEKYALRQHEELGYKHTEGKAKFVEDPFNEHIDKLQDYIAEGVEEGTE